MTSHAADRSRPYSDAVDESIITLKALTYQPPAGSSQPPPRLCGRTRRRPRLGLPLLLASRRHLRAASAVCRLQARSRSVAGLAAPAIAGQPETLQILSSIDGQRLPRSNCPGSLVTNRAAQSAPATPRRPAAARRLERDSGRLVPRPQAGLAADPTHGRCPSP